MAETTSASDASSLPAVRSWSEAEYFRLLSHELPLEDVELPISSEKSESGEKPEHDELFGDLSPGPKLPNRTSIGNKKSVGHFNSNAASLSVSPLASTRASCSSTDPSTFSNDRPSRGASRRDIDTMLENQHMQGVAYEAMSDRWIAFWTRSGHKHIAGFSCTTYGHRKARQMAVQCRQKAAALGLTDEQPKPKSPASSGRSKQSKTAQALQATSVPQSAAPACDKEAADPNGAGKQPRQKRGLEGSSTTRADTDRVSAFPKVTGVRFQVQRNRFVAEWYDQGKTRMAYFPVKQYGFEEARRMAIECRKRVLLSKHQRLANGCKACVGTKQGADGPYVEPKNNAKGSTAPIPQSDAAPLVWKRQCVTHPLETKESELQHEIHQTPKPSSRPEDSSEEQLMLAQAALNAVLIDLLSKCLPAFCGEGTDRYGARELVELLHKQLQCIRSAKEFSQLRPYLTVAQGPIASGVLPSSFSPQAQIRILMDFLEVAALRG